MWKIMSINRILGNGKGEHPISSTQSGFVTEESSPSATTPKSRDTSDTRRSTSPTGSTVSTSECLRDASANASPKAKRHKNGGTLSHPELVPIQDHKRVAPETAPEKANMATVRNKGLERPSDFSVLPIQKKTWITTGHNRSKDERANSEDSEGAAMPHLKGPADPSPDIEQSRLPSKITEYVDLNDKDGQTEQGEVPLENDVDCGAVQLESREGSEKSADDDTPRRPQAPAVRSHNVEPRSQPFQKPFTDFRPAKVTKKVPTLRHRSQLLPPGHLSGPQSRGPSEEDLYFLLLHRMRQREQTDKQLAARLKQLEGEKGNLSEELEDYAERLHNSVETTNRQTAEIEAQKTIIDNIKKSYVKIQDFMTSIQNDQIALTTQAQSMKEDNRALREENVQLQGLMQEAKGVNVSSSKSFGNIKTDIVTARQQNSDLENSLCLVKTELWNERKLLAEEKRRNTRFEQHIVELTRKQDNFSTTIIQEQQHLLNALGTIRGKLINMETRSYSAGESSSLPAVDKCVEMLDALTKAETADSADFADMIQVVQALTER
jgi:hypothetical protein